MGFEFLAKRIFLRRVFKFSMNTIWKGPQAGSGSSGAAVCLLAHCFVVASGETFAAWKLEARKPWQACAEMGGHLQGIQRIAMGGNHGTRRALMEKFGKLFRLLCLDPSPMPMYPC